MFKYKASIFIEFDLIKVKKQKPANSRRTTKLI